MTHEYINIPDGTTHCLLKDELFILDIKWEMDMEIVEYG